MAIGFALDVVIESGCTAGNEHGAEDDVKQFQPGDRTGGAHVKARARGHQNEERDVGLRERDIGAELAGLRQRGGLGDSAH